MDTEVEPILDQDPEVAPEVAVLDGSEEVPISGDEIENEAWGLAERREGLRLPEGRGVAGEPAGLTLGTRRPGQVPEMPEEDPRLVSDLLGEVPEERGVYGP